MAVLIDRSTRLIVQGITGREAVNLTNDEIFVGAAIFGTAATSITATARAPIRSSAPAR